MTITLPSITTLSDLELLILSLGIGFAVAGVLWILWALRGLIIALLSIVIPTWIAYVVLRRKRDGN